MAHKALRGAPAAITFSAVRIAADHPLETATRVERSPSIWPAEVLAVDTLHESVYAVATGVVADRMLSRSRHAARGA